MSDRLEEIEWTLKHIKQTEGAVADITWLVEEVKKLREEVKRLQEQLDRPPNLVS